MRDLFIFFLKLVVSLSPLLELELELELVDEDDEEVNGSFAFRPILRNRLGFGATGARIVADGKYWG